MNDFEIGSDPRIIEKEFPESILMTIVKILGFFMICAFALFLMKLNMEWLLRNRDA